MSLGSAQRLSRARRVGAVAGARRAHGGAAARPAARARRRQVAGRVPDRRPARDAVRRFAREICCSRWRTLERSCAFIRAMTPTTHQSRACAAASGTRAAGRPSKPKSALACGVVGRAIAPAGASRGSREAVDLRDGGTRHRRSRRGAGHRQRARPDRPRALRHGRARAGGNRRPADRARRHAEQGANSAATPWSPCRSRSRRPRRWRTTCRCGSTSPATAR